MYIFQTNSYPDYNHKNNKNSYGKRIAKSNRVTLCFGSLSNSSKTVSGKYAGVTVEKINDLQKEEKLKFKCIGNFQNLDFLLFNEEKSLFENLPINKKFVKNPIDETLEEEICQDLYVFQMFNTSEHTYDSHLQNCHLMAGRMLTETESYKFSKVLNGIYNRSKSESDEQVAKFWMSKHGLPEAIVNNHDYCAQGIFGRERISTGFLPCNFGFKLNFCIAPKLYKFYLYGPLNKFDKDFCLHANDGNVKLISETTGILKKPNRGWELNSFKHGEKAYLVNESIPMGRKNWTLKNENYLMTLTFCNPTEFACTTGECLPITARCNSTEECEDSSDEENCETMLKRKGYLKDTPPPPPQNKTYLTMTVNITIYDMTDISSKDGKIILDMAIFYMWHDIKLAFLNPLSIRTLNCDDIWRPKLAMSDDLKYGFQIEFKSYTSECHFDRQTLLTDKTKIKKLYTDSFMGKLSINYLTHCIDTIFFFKRCSTEYVYCVVYLYQVIVCYTIKVYFQIKKYIFIS